MDPKTLDKGSAWSQRNSSSNVKSTFQPDMDSHGDKNEQGSHAKQGNSERGAREDSTTSIVSRPQTASGSSGTTEAFGASGSSGTTEAFGASGSSGTTEAFGASGSSGTTEAFGASGSSGTTEASGASGLSGTRDARVQQVERNELVLAEGASSCCQLDELKRLAECDSTPGGLAFSKTHTVLIDVSAFNCGQGILPQPGKDMWNSSFVKMPCSPVDVITKTLSKVPRWKLISKQLKGLAKKKSVHVREVLDAIASYNPKYMGQWSFDALLNFVEKIPSPENYFSTLFPKIAALALQLPNEVQKAIPLLRTGHAAAITLSQCQISCLLANAFFCTFPHRNASGPNAEYHNYPTINFSSLFGNWSDQKKEKLRAIMHYFKTVTDEKPHGLVTFERRCLKDTVKPSWKRSTETLQKLHVTASGSIENEGSGMLQVDFASSWIGGGVLSSGLVQEEILFLIYPELIVSRLFTEKLADNECLIVTGSQQFSSYSGFRENFEWAGPFEDNLERDEWWRLKRQILAIDALNFRHRREQYTMRSIERELNKAYCGFQRREPYEPDIATGKWGCGAFKGDKQLKALIQLVAAAKAQRGLAFFTFGDEELVRDLEQIYHLLVKRRITVDKLYRLLEDYCAVLQQSGSHVDLFGFIGNTIRTVRHQL